LFHAYSQSRKSNIEMLNTLQPHRQLPILILAAMLSACAGASPQAPATAQPAPTLAAAQPTAPAPTAPAPTLVPQPTALPEPAAAPTVVPEPTTAPQTGAVLPAPLLYTANEQGGINQIWRLERDGTTRTLLVEEPPAKDMLTIVEFAVSPVDGALAYLVQGADGYTLVRTDADGKNRKELLPAGSISQLRWSPDGKQIAMAIYRAADATTGLAGGVYLLPAEGGEPQLLQANDQIKDAANPAPESRGYSPEAWSHDGEAIILSAFSQSVELCDVAVKYIATGDLVVFQAPDDMHTACGSGVWDPEDQNIYVGMRRPGYMAPIPGLWRATPTNGKTVPQIPGEPTKGTYNLVAAPQPVKDGVLNLFLATTDKLEEPGDDPSKPPTQYAMLQQPADATTSQKLRDESFADIEGRVLWAPDGSGALIEQSTDATSGASKLLWAPANAAPLVELADDLSINNLHWGQSVLGAK
jgi:hypothetical protein